MAGHAQAGSEGDRMSTLFREVDLHYAQPLVQQSPPAAVVIDLEALGADLFSISIEAYAAWTTAVVAVRKVNDPSQGTPEDYASPVTLTSGDRQTGLLKRESRYLVLIATTGEGAALPVDIRINVQRGLVVS